MRIEGISDYSRHSSTPKTNHVHVPMVRREESLLTEAAIRADGGAIALGDGVSVEACGGA